jgi:hypothetical protein
MLLVAWRLRVRQDRRSSLLRRLLPEHHVYVRSGSTSRYVVLTWPWQLGVSLALVGVAVWAGLASFGWLGAHLETLDQRRHLARLAQANEQLEALVAARAEEAASAIPARLTTLVAQLEGVKSEAQPRIEPPDAAAAEAGQPWRGPLLDGGLTERLLPAAMPADKSGSGRDWLYDRIARHGPHDLRGSEAIRLRAQLRAARAEIARLENALGEARSEIAER